MESLYTVETFATSAGFRAHSCQAHQVSIDSPPNLAQNSPSMRASLCNVRAKSGQQIVTKIVTKSAGNPGQSGAQCHQNCHQTEGTPGQCRATGSTTSGYEGQWRATRGNFKFGLITQRSHVQIMPPQPIDSMRLSCVFSASKNVTNFGAVHSKLLIIKSWDCLQLVGFSQLCALGGMESRNQRISEGSSLLPLRL